MKEVKEVKEVNEVMSSNAVMKPKRSSPRLPYQPQSRLPRPLAPIDDEPLTIAELRAIQLERIARAPLGEIAVAGHPDETLHFIERFKPNLSRF